MFSLSRVLPLNVPVHASGIQLQIRQTLFSLSVEITRRTNKRSYKISLRWRLVYTWSDTETRMRLAKKRFFHARYLACLVLLMEYTFSALAALLCSPALGTILCFLALGTCSLFSRAWSYRFYVLPRLAPVLCFPALATGSMILCIF